MTLPLFIKGTIDDWIRDKEWTDIVKIYHNEKREGLIRARVIGAKHATGSVLVYLDAHCEVEPNWLPPLLTPIAQDYRLEFTVIRNDRKLTGIRPGVDWSHKIIST